MTSSKCVHKGHHIRSFISEFLALKMNPYKVHMTVTTAKDNKKERGISMKKGLLIVDIL